MREERITKVPREEDINKIISHGKLKYAVALFFTSAVTGFASTVPETTLPSSSQPILQPTESPTPTPTSTSAVPELSWLAVVPLLLFVFSVALVLRHRKTLT